MNTRSPLHGICLVLLLMPGLSYAMPNFARKYEKNCGMCHTQVPQLNRTGYEFRAAGYRTPDEIGKKEKASDFNFADIFAARLQGTYTYSRHDDVNDAKDSSQNQLEFKEATLYPMTGAWGGNFGSLVELSMSPDDVFEVENAYVRGVWGDASGWFTGKLGVMHPWEGFGASDRPIGISRPLIQKKQATGSPFFLWNLDEVAAELGYYFARTGTTVSARVGNGVLWKEDGSGTAEPAQGGALSKPKNLPAHNAKSYQVVLNQIVRQDSGFTVYWYRTTIPSPNPYDADGNLNPGPFTVDQLDRLAVYANFYALPKTLDVLAGYGYGKDRLDDPTLAPNVGNSNGWFGEVDYFAIENKLAVGARYDRFDPSNKVDHDSVSAISVFGNAMLYPGLQLIGEYKHTDTEAGGNPGKNRDDSFQLLGIFIW